VVLISAQGQLDLHLLPFMCIISYR